MTTLSDIEAAIDSLKPEERRELLLFVASRIRMESLPLPEPREFSMDEMQEWIAQDEADMKRYRETE